MKAPISVDGISVSRCGCVNYRLRLLRVYMEIKPVSRKGQVALHHNTELAPASILKQAHLKEKP